MKKQVNTGRCEVEYEVGKKILLNVKNFIMLEGPHSKVPVHICDVVSDHGMRV